MQQLKLSDPDVEFFACGGPAMVSQNVHMLADLVSLSVMGGLEVLFKYNAIRKIFKKLVNFLDRERPDALILVDYPGFNLRLAAQAKAKGIGVIYYVSPQIWAWAPERIQKIRCLVDLMLVILPFEKGLYERAGVPVRYVGHPSLDRTAHVSARHPWLASQGLDPQARYVGLLPGSRVMEIQKILPVLLDAACIIARELPKTTFLIPCAGGHLEAGITSALQKSLLDPSAFRIVQGQALEVTRACELVLVASGTATLETALMDTPMLIVYKVNPLTYLIARMLVRLEYIGLVNVLAGRLIVPEFLQHRARGPLIAKEALALLGSAERQSQMKAHFEKIRQDLGPAGASDRAAQAVHQWLGKSEKSAAIP